MPIYSLSQLCQVRSVLTKKICTPSDSRSVFLGFSDITECEKAGLMCPLGTVCEGQKDSGYTCACNDGYIKIPSAEGNSKCQGIKISENYIQKQSQFK